MNNHPASLSAFTTWVDSQAPGLFPAGDPAKGIKELRLPPLEPRALSEAQVRSLKNVCDRLERFHELKGREWKERLAEYLEVEWLRDAGDAAESAALFLSAVGTPARRNGGRPSVRAINLLLERIGRWHDGEVTDPAREISPLRPHDLRHTFAYRLAVETGKDAYELERRLGHGSQRYVQRYTNPPKAVAAGYVEEF